MPRPPAVPLLLTLVVSSLSVFTEQADRWIEFSSPEGHFSALFPGQPEYKTREQTSPQMKRPYTVRILTWTDRNVFLGVVCVEYDPEFRLSVGGELEANQNKFLKEVKAKLVTSRRTEFERAPGDLLPALEFSGAAAGASFKGVVVVDGHRVCQWTSATKKNYDGSAIMERFMRSFKLKSPRKISQRVSNRSRDRSRLRRQFAGRVL